MNEETDVEQGPEANGHVRISARQAWGAAGLILLGVSTWAVADHVKVKGEVAVISTTQKVHGERIEDIEGRTRSLEAVRKAEEEHVTLMRQLIDKLDREEKRKR